VLADCHTALHALTGIVEGMLARTFRQGNPLQAHRQARVIHHGEHIAQAFVFHTHQVAHGADIVSIGHSAGGTGVNTQLVLDADRVDIVALANLASFIDQEFRHDKQRNTLHPRWRIGRAGEHQMDNIVGVGLVTPGDEYFLPEQPIVLAIALGAGFDHPKIRPCLGFSEIHRARPLAADQSRQVQVFLLLGTKAPQGGDHSLGKHGQEGKRHIGALQDFVHGKTQGMGQALATIGSGTRQAWPASAPIGGVDTV